MGCSAMRAMTSVSQACGSTPLRRGGSDQGVEDRGAAAALVGAGEEVVLPAQGQGALMARSAALFESSRRPSSMRRVSAAHRDVE